MTVDFIISLGREVMEVTAIVAAPVLGVGLVVGVVISIFQTITSIQEMSLTFVPKIVSVMLVLVLMGPWILSVLLNFMTRLFINLPLYAK